MLLMCRICRIQDKSMYCINNTKLQAMYELLTNLSFQTNDNRPTHVCYICCAKLRNCYRLQTTCLESEEIFTQMLPINKCESYHQVSLGNTNTFTIIHPLLNLSFEDSDTLEECNSPLSDDPLSVYQNAKYSSDIIKQESHIIEDDAASATFVDDEYINDDKSTVWDDDLEYHQNSIIGSVEQSEANEAAEDLDAVIPTEDCKTNIEHDEPFNKQIKDSIIRAAQTAKVVLYRIETTLPKTKLASSSSNELDAVNGYEHNTSPVTKTHSTPDPGTSTKRPSMKTKRSAHNRTNKILNKCDEINLHRPLGKHTNEKPYYECEICSKKYFRKPNLIKHINEHSLQDPSEKWNAANKNVDKKRNIQTDTTDKQYICDICSRTFSGKHYLIKHISKKKRCVKKPYSCDTCSKSFIKKHNLIEHIERSHAILMQSKPFECHKCEKTYSKRGYLTKHNRDEHSGTKDIVCEICNKRFLSKYHLKDHSRCHSDKKCEICKKYFATSNDLTLHSATHAIRTHKCNVCYKGFVSEYNLINHACLHTPTRCDKQYKCDICNESFTNRDFGKHYRQNHPFVNLFVCDICNRNFHEKVKLRLHIDRHMRVHKCRLCNKRFESRARLKKHDCKLTCDRCGITFATKNKLKLHGIEIHGDKGRKCERCNVWLIKKDHVCYDLAPKLHLCDLCGKTFISTETLISHKKSHTLPYKCKLCNKGFQKESRLADHIASHTGEKRYKCEICNKGLATKATLRKHHRTHTGEKPYKCHICEKSFAVSGTFKAHLRIHTGEKPHKCDVCGKGFNQRSARNTHVLSHSGQKRYQCDVCEKSFYSKGVLTTHIRTHKGQRVKKIKNKKKI